MRDLRPGLEPLHLGQLKASLSKVQLLTLEAREQNMMNDYRNGGAGMGVPTPLANNTSFSGLDNNPKSIMARPPRFAFRPATRENIKLRMALAGPGGAGKTYTLLKLTSMLGWRTAVADTEHGSSEKYADVFPFDVVHLDSCDPDIVPDLIADVAAQGYDCLGIDSWSHFWMGKDGELEQVDRLAAKSKSNNSFAAWRNVSPKHTKMIDAILRAPIHIMVTMRVKTEWIVETSEKGKSVPRKIGLAPVMKDGVEYEFDVCADLDQDNNLIITKTRCPKLFGVMYYQPGRELAEVLGDWLTPAPASRVAAPQTKRWRTRGEVRTAFAALREQLGARTFIEGLETFSAKSTDDLLRLNNVEECYDHLMALAAKQGAA